MSMDTVDRPSISLTWPDLFFLTEWEAICLHFHRILCSSSVSVNTIPDHLVGIECVN